MFSFFNKKRQEYNLEWLEVDMHSHLIPGIDDGCSDEKVSLHCVGGLLDLGYKQLYTTPHILPGMYDNDFQTIHEGLGRLEAAWRQEQQGRLPVRAAAEYMITPDFDKTLTNGELCMLPNEHMLIEMSYLAESTNIEQIIFQMQIMNLRPILAHPERYTFYFKNKKYYKRLRDLGCELQCNLLSFSGYYGKEVKAAAYYLAENGWVDFIGTDLHHKKHLEQLRYFVSKCDTRNIFHKCDIKNVTLLPQTA